jgi:uncharacterized protein
LVAATLFLAHLASAQVPPPAGLVTDRAGVIDAAEQRRITQLIEELRQKTGAEIAVVTVDTTAPLDDFTYAMQLADAWKPGKKGEDTGLLILVAVKDRKVRVVTGYGLEGILPDGLVGEIQDKEMVPAFRAGRVAEGIWRGVSAFARRIAAERGVALTGAPAGARARPRDAAPRIPVWVIVLVFVVVMLAMSRSGGGPTGRLRRGRRGGGPIFIPGGFGGGDGDRGFPGGFGGGGGGFGGFGGGGFGGGGAGRGW